MDTDTGEIYAMASVRRNDDTGVVEITSGNFAAVDAYEPGSVAKVDHGRGRAQRGRGHARHGLQRPVARAVGRRPAGRRRAAPRRVAHRRPDPHQVVEHRHDPRSTRRSGARSTGSTCGRFGLGEATALDFPGESPGIMKNWKDLWGSERVTVAYGQGVSSTSIQLVVGDQRDRQRRHVRRAEARAVHRRSRRRR